MYQQIKNGDPAAFDALFRQHYEGLVKYAYTKVQEITIAEDLVQSVFINLWVKKATLNIEHSIPAYLKTAVHNRCMDYFRKESRQQKKEAAYQQNSLLLDVRSPEAELLSKESIQAIYQKIKALPPKSQAVFRLSRFEQMTYQQIADALDISKKTVEMHISISLRILRKTVFIWFLFFHSF